jgi:Skp family chaperone for outer membrane proteins
MDRNTIYAGVSVVLAGLLGFTWAKGGNTLNADEARAAGAAQEIAVVDLSKVFAGHKAFLDESADLQREVERAKEDSKAMLSAGNRLGEELKLHKQGTAEHNRIAKELKEKADAFKKFNEESQKRLTEKQAGMTLKYYYSINEEVQRIAVARGIKLVVNYGSDPIDPKDLSKMMQVVNRQVLYQNGLDITDEVLQAVN